MRRLLPLAMAVILAGCAAAAVAGAAWGAALLAAGGVCDHAAPDASSETEPAKIKPAAIRIVFSLKVSLWPASAFCLTRASAPCRQYPSWGGTANATAWRTQWRICRRTG